MSDSMVTKFLNPNAKGGVRSITVGTLEKLAGAMGVSPQWLAFGDESPIVDNKLADIWNRIPHARRSHVLTIIETFAESSISE